MYSLLEIEKGVHELEDKSIGIIQYEAWRDQKTKKKKPQ